MPIETTKLVATSPIPIVSMVEFKGRLFVATREAVFERDEDGVFRKVQFEYVREVPHAD